MPSQPRKVLKESQRKSIAVLSAAGYSCDTLSSKNLFNVMASSPAEIVLIHIVTERWPDSERLKAIRSYPTPRNTRKLIHLWRNYARTPDVREVK